MALAFPCETDYLLFKAKYFPTEDLEFSWSADYFVLGKKSENFVI